MCDAFVTFYLLWLDKVLCVFALVPHGDTKRKKVAAFTSGNPCGFLWVAFTVWTKRRSPYVINNTTKSSWSPFRLDWVSFWSPNLKFILGGYTAHLWSFIITATNSSWPNVNTKVPSLFRTPLFTLKQDTYGQIEHSREKNGINSFGPQVKKHLLPQRGCRFKFWKCISFVFKMSSVKYSSPLEDLPGPVPHQSSTRGLSSVLYTAGSSFCSHDTMTKI